MTALNDPYQIETFSVVNTGTPGPGAAAGAAGSDRSVCTVSCSDCSMSTPTTTANEQFSRVNNNKR